MMFGGYEKETSIKTLSAVRQRIAIHATGKGEMPMALLHLTTSLWSIFIVMLLILSGLASAETERSCTPSPYGFNRADDDNFEFIFQWGSFGSGDIWAWTAASDTGYTFDHLPLGPRLGLKADITSGDNNPDNSDLQTFNPLFPKGAYFSEDGLIGPANLMDLNPNVDLHFTEGITLSVN
jgi:hypothetical protein